MRLEGTAVSGDRLRVMEEAEHERAFFPVSKIRVHATDTGHTFRRHWAIVSEDRNEIFSIVTEDYQLVSNARAYELGRRAFGLVFGKDAVAGLGLFNVIMPATRSWAHIDMTAESTAFEPRRGDPWRPFLRVTNSYNRSRALAFTVGICRWICRNGMIFGEQSLKLRVAHTADVDVDRRLADAFTHHRFDVAGCTNRLERLTRLSVPAERFVAGMLEILVLKVPAEPPRNAATRDGWTRLGIHLRYLAATSLEEHGTSAYALVNAASDYASDATAPLMSVSRVSALQFRCGHWIDRMLKRYGPSLASGTEVDIKPGSMSAARRLLAMNGADAQSQAERLRAQSGNLFGE